MLHTDWLFFTSLDPFHCEWKGINRVSRLPVESVPVDFITTRLSLRVVFVIKYVDTTVASIIK